MIALPFPPSTNRIWRISRSRVGAYLDPRYKAWKRAADAEYFIHKREWKPVAGHFEITIVLDEKYTHRKRSDCDNRIKVILDWLQRVDLIEDDKLCDYLSVGWGHAPEGCRITLSPADGSMRRVA